MLRLENVPEVIIDYKLIIDMGGGRDHLVLLSYIVYEKTESRKREVICQYSV